MKIWKKTGMIGLTTAVCLVSVAPGAYAQSVPAGHNSAAAVSPMAEGLLPIAADSAAAVTGEAPLDAKISRDRAVELAREYAQLDSEFELQNVNYQGFVHPYNNRRGTWHVNFHVDDRSQFRSASVSLDADSGKLISFYVNRKNPDEKPEYPPKVGYDQAKQIAEDWISRLNPDEKDQLVFVEQQMPQHAQPLFAEVSYNIRFDRVVHGIPFSSNYISATIDGDGQVTQYQYQWEPELSFEKVDQPISKEQAIESFRKQLKPRLQYIVPYTYYGNEPELMLAYELSELPVIDAKTGDIVKSGMSHMNFVNSDSPVTEQPLSDPDAAPLNLSKEAAEERARKLLPIPADAKLDSAQYNENFGPNGNGQNSSAWDLRWVVPNSERDNSNIWATVDSQTGNILRFSKYDYRIAAEANQSGGQTYTVEQLRAKAIETVKQLLPTHTHQLYLESEPMLQASGADQLKIMPPSHYPFVFKRKINGIYTEYDQVSISFDPKTGELQDYYSNMSGREYPAEKPAVIDEAEAVEQFMSLYSVELRYVMDVEVPNYGGPMPLEKYNLLIAAGEISPEAVEAKPKTKLVYSLIPTQQFNYPYFLDAVSGVWKNRDNGEEVKLVVDQATDLEGHPAAHALQLMIDYRALDVVDGKVNPEQEITRGEMIKMLLLTLNNGFFPMHYKAAYAERGGTFSDVSADSPYFAYVENAVERNLIDRNSSTFNPDEKITKQELADLITRALGLKSLSEHEALFNLEAGDADQIEHKGAVAIVVGLEIMPLADGIFQPDEQVTRAQGATAFYEFLRARAQLKDMPMF